MDPIIIYACLAVLAVILWLGVIDKLWHFTAFELSVAGYQLLPAVMHRPFAIAFVASELAAGLLLLAPPGRVAGALLALAVLVVATCGVVVNLVRGNTDIDCGCGGLSRFAEGLTWWIVGRNALLAGLAVLVLMFAGAASRDLVWLDGITFFGTALAMLGLYFVLNQLIASHMHMQKVRSQS